MSNVLPRPEEIFFLLCEDVRQEIDKKLSLLGVFTGGGMIVPKGSTISNINFMCVWFVRGGIGKFAVDFELAGPAQFNSVKAASGTLDKATADHAVLVFAFKPLPGMPTGTYKAQLFLDGNKFEQSFDVIEAT